MELSIALFSRTEQFLIAPLYVYMARALPTPYSCGFKCTYFATHALANLESLSQDSVYRACDFNNNAAGDEERFFFHDIDSLFFAFLI